jgi:hypothetical protein
VNIWPFTSDDTTRIAFPTDEHVPFQDDKARQVALKIVQDFKPTHMPAGSDALDFYQLSRFDKDPMRAKTIQNDVDAWMKIQKEWQSAAPTAKRRFLRGNHEFRFEKELWKLPSFCDLDVLKLENILELDRFGIENGIFDEWDLGSLLITHGSVVRQQSAASARGEVERQRHQISTMTGHTHRGGTYYTSTRTGMVTGIECFCLCQLDPWYVNRKLDWQQGIVLATIHKDKSLQFEPIPFFRVDGKVAAHWRDKEYTE